MPLSKKRQAEWMRNYRKTVIPNDSLRQPSPLLDVITRASGDTVPIEFQPSDGYILGAIKYLDDVPVPPELQAWEITNWANSRGSNPEPIGDGYSPSCKATYT